MRVVAPPDPDAVSRARARKCAGGASASIKSAHEHEVDFVKIATCTGAEPGLAVQSSPPLLRLAASETHPQARPERCFKYDERWRACLEAMPGGSREKSTFE